MDLLLPGQGLCRKSRGRYITPWRQFTKTVDTPWTSREYEVSKKTPVSLSADGPEGSALRCVLKWRSKGGRGNPSGTHADQGSPANERCHFDTEVP
jgi:hypothetical protein